MLWKMDPERPDDLISRRSFRDILWICHNGVAGGLAHRGTLCRPSLHREVLVTTKENRRLRR